MFTTRRIAIIVIALALILGFLFWKFAPNFSEKAVEKGPITLNVYGLWEEENLITPALVAYKKLHPEVTIKYNYQSSTNYRTRVQTQLDGGSGPDIFMIHNSWLPMFEKGNYLSVMPPEVMILDEYSKTFYPIVKDSFTVQSNIYALPRGVDGLALFYNPKLLQNIGAKVPRNWDEFVDVATKLTVKDQSGNITTAGAAIGSTGNVDHWSDILGLLLLQQYSLRGLSPENINTREGSEVLKFYTDFVVDLAKKVWDTRFERSTQAFASERVAMYFAPSWRAHELRVLNPSLDFKVTAVPHLNGTQVNWGTFWGYGVSAKSVNQKEAWEFLKFFTSRESEKLLYQEAAKVRLFGLPYSRVDLQGEVLQDPLVGAFVAQGPNYKNWYLSSNTFDKGINDEMIKYFEDGVNSILFQGNSVDTALQTISQGVKQVMDKYVNVTAAPVGQSNR